MKLHHTVHHIPEEEIAKSIQLNGIVPQVADVYKDLVPEEVRYLPIIWLAQGIWQGWSYPIFEIDTRDLDENYLYPIAFTHEKDKELDWWIYQGYISPNVINRIERRVK